MSDPKIAVLTPTKAEPERMTWFHKAHHSLHENNHFFEHIIIVDGGDQRYIPTSVSSCQDVKIVVLPHPVGSAAARNIGLHTINEPGTYVTTLDDDDMLPEHSLDIRAAALDSGVAWVAGNLSHLHPDGSIVPWKAPTPIGHLKPGEVMQAWGKPENSVPLGPTTIMSTVERVRIAGGWYGLPTGEDLVFIAGLTGFDPGLMLDETVYLYRIHEHQSLKVSPHAVFEQTVREIAFQRANAITELSQKY